MGILLFYVMVRLGEIDENKTSALYKATYFVLGSVVVRVVRFQRYVGDASWVRNFSRTGFWCCPVCDCLALRTVEVPEWPSLALAYNVGPVLASLNRCCFHKGRDRFSITRQSKTMTKQQGNTLSAISWTVGHSDRQKDRLYERIFSNAWTKLIIH